MTFMEGRMKQTEMYHLSQWEPGDRILREDFNSDNGKIEAALLGRLGRCQFIKAISPEKTTTQVQLDLSDIDWNEWECVAVIFEQSPGPTTEYFTCSLYGEDGANLRASCGNDSYNIAHFGSGPFLLAFLPWHSAANQIRAVSLAAVSSFGYSDSLFSELKAVYVSRSASGLNFSTSHKFTVWGIR